jgi:hypothetical protein
MPQLLVLLPPQMWHGRGGVPETRPDKPAVPPSVTKGARDGGITLSRVCRVFCI